MELKCHMLHPSSFGTLRKNPRMSRPKPRLSLLQIFPRQLDSQRRDFGIAEIDVTQSRDSDALSLLKDIFFFLCRKTDWGMELDWDGAEALSDAFSEYMRRPRGGSDPVIYDPYADEELDNSYWD